MTEKPSARRGSSRLCARRQGTVAARATARCAVLTASAAAKQRSWRLLPFALSLTFDVRAGRQHRLMPMASARHLCSHSRREFCGSLAGEERFPVVVSGLVLLVHASGTRSGQQATSQINHSDPEICHRKPPLFPSPETVQYSCAIQGQLVLVAPRVPPPLSAALLSTRAAACNAARGATAACCMRTILDGLCHSHL